MNIQKKTVRLVSNALLCGITFLLGFTPLGMLPLPFISPTTVHIPVLIATLYLGYKSGLLVALCFGLVSFIRAFYNPIGLAYFFQNPLIAIVPRLCIPLVTYFCYKLLKKCIKYDYVNLLISSFLGSISNTILTLGSILMFYGDALNTMINNFVSGGNVNAMYYDRSASWLISVVGLPYGLSEAVLAAFIVPAIVYALKKAIK